MNIRHGEERPDGQGTARPQPTNPNLVRDHLANERTLLAWVRTSIAVAALGFVVARFGLILREMGPSAARHTSTLVSTGLGVGLVGGSALLVVLATLHYRHTARSIDRNTYEPPALLMLLLAGGFVVVAVLLGLYLLATA